MSGWDDLLHWGRELTKVLDLDREERDYKIEFATNLAHVRPAVLADSNGWPEQLRRALTSANLVNQYFYMALAEDLKNRPTDIRSAVLTLWQDDEPDPAQLDLFASQLRPLHSRYTAGNATALGSLLLMAPDPSSYPPYRAEALISWCQLTGGPVPTRQDGATERYRRLLRFCDDLLERAPASGIELRDRLDAQSLAWMLLKADPPTAWSTDTAAAFRNWRGENLPVVSDDEDEKDAQADRGVGPSPRIEQAVWTLLGAGLRGESSPLGDGVVTWTAANARELTRRLLGGDENSKDSFLTKLRRQLDGATPGVITLAAELLYIQAAPLTNMKPDSKRERVATVLSWLAPPRVLPSDLSQALDDHCAFNGGVGFNVQLWQQLLWLCRLVEYWSGLPGDQRESALADPWAFRQVLAQVPQDWPSIRHSIQYLAWPGTFEAIVSPDHRRRIHAAFADRIGGPTGTDDEAIDRDLAALREVLPVTTTDNGGEYVDWYRPPFAPMWQRGKDQGTRAWLIRPKPGGSRLAQAWFNNGFVSLAARYLESLPPGASLQEVRDAVEAGYDHQDYAQRLTLANEYHSFLSTMKSDDLVATVVDDQLHVGLVTGDPTYTEDDGSRLRRSVSWGAATVRQAAAQAPIPSLLAEPGTIVDLTAALDQLTDYLGETPVDESDDTAIPRPPTTLRTPGIKPELRSITDELADALHLPVDSLQAITDLLADRQQIVLFGPPGTGKTFLAKNLARFLVGDDASRATVVQFHPSYAYEDFFEGYRPDVEAGTATFTLKPGPLRRLAAEAADPDNTGQPYVLIIDEMNRANLAKVFGELYFLLEYRDESIQLQYSPSESFRLPANFFIIGTMNTADRSIALVDAAIRRRFAFVELHPDEPPIDGLLGRFLAAQDVAADDQRVDLLHALNAEIEDADRDLRIGPSYLMRAEAATPDGLERIWRYDLLPLLEEHYYGRLDRRQVHARFGLDALRAKVTPPAAAGIEIGPPTTDPGAAEQ